MQFSQSTDYLQQYIFELADLSVLLEVHPEIHIETLENEEYCIIRELCSDQWNNVLALLIFCSVQNLVFKVELLCQHVVLFKSLISVSSYEVSSMLSAGNIPSQIDLVLMIPNSFLDHSEDSRAILGILHQYIIEIPRYLNVCPYLLELLDLLEIRLCLNSLLLFDQVSNNKSWLDSNLLNFFRLMLLNDMVLKRWGMWVFLVTHRTNNFPIFLDMFHMLSLSISMHVFDMLI